MIRYQVSCHPQLLYGSDKKNPFPTQSSSSLYLPISANQSEWEQTRNAFAEKMAVFDPIYKELSDEKLAGWQSEAVGALWKSRTRKFKVQSSGNRAEDSRKFTPEDTKYYKFYCDVLSQYAPGLFVNTGNNEKFIDIGSAPGGLSRFLNTVCGWKGYAFSLSPAEGGLQMKYSNPSKLSFSMANMTKENEWKRVVDLASKAGYKNVEFVNMGVVVDYGQVESDNGDSALMACRAIHASVSQFLILLHTLKDGGSAMWIHSLSHLDSLFFFIQYAVKCFESVRLLNTLAPARSPVYIILRGFKKHSKEASDFKEKLLTDGGLVTIDTIPKWQVCNFDVIKDVMESYPVVRSDIHAIWNQKRDCLRQTRLFAEKRFASDKAHFVDSDAAATCLSVISGAEATLPAPLVSESIEFKERKSHARPTASGVCSVSSSEAGDAPTNLLQVPKTFGPPGRRK